MKKSTLFVARNNFQIKSKKQYIKLIKHIIRLIKTKNIDQAKKHLNEFIFFENGKTIDISKLSVQELYDKIINNLEQTIEEYKLKNHNSKEKQEFIRKLKDQRRNTKNRLEGKGLSLEAFEDSGLSCEDYINQNWTKEYKSEKMIERMKNRTADSLNKYIEMKSQDTDRKDNSLKLTSMHTLFQELVIKVPIPNGVDFTSLEMNKIIKKQIEKETSRGNEVIFVSIHNDESSKHCHIMIKNKGFKLVENQQNDVLKKYNLDYDLKQLTKEQLEKIGELEQKSDYNLVNSQMEQDIKFDLAHIVNENITNEERKNSNRLANKKNHYSQNIDNREFNYINLEKERIFKETKELIIDKLQIIYEKLSLKKLKKTIKLKILKKPLQIKKRQLNIPNFKGFNNKIDKEQEEVLEIKNDLKKRHYLVSDENIEIMKKMKKLNDIHEMARLVKTLKIKPIKVNGLESKNQKKLSNRESIKRKVKKYYDENPEVNQPELSYDYNSDNNDFK